MFSENFKRLKKERRLTSYRIAKDLNIHQSTVANWEKGMRPQLENAYKLANYFGVNLDELLK